MPVIIGQPPITLEWKNVSKALNAEVSNARCWTLEGHLIIRMPLGAYFLWKTTPESGEPRSVTERRRASHSVSVTRMPVLSWRYGGDVVVFWSRPWVFLGVIFWCCRVTFLLFRLCHPFWQVLDIADQGSSYPARQERGGRGHGEHVVGRLSMGEDSRSSRSVRDGGRSAGQGEHAVDPPDSS